MTKRLNGLPLVFRHEDMDLISDSRRRQLMSQQSTQEIRKGYAICVRRAYKSYGGKENRNIILDSLDMTVQKGSIYGLLGASGCGKTTLLSCIVGRRHLDSGEIWVLGGCPGTPGSGVPGPRVAYMPQELALYGEFTIMETLLFFGWINKTSTEAIMERSEFLLKLLQLPNSSNFVKNLSGGQQRRVSLAATLIYDAELLIFDEPTVGVDPEIRQSIWDYIVELTKYGQQTVVITTHYIEEARQAHKIGLMRDGRFLSEASPDSMLQKYNCSCLEDVYLKLAVKQNNHKEFYATHIVTNNGVIPTNNGNIIISEIDKTTLSDQPPIPEQEIPKITFIKKLQMIKGHHMKALYWKNFLWMSRNWIMMVAINSLPLVQMVFFSYAFGREPDILHLAIANNELSYDQMIAQKCPLLDGCNQTYLSCRYLDYLDNQKVELTHYLSDEEALDAVRHGRAWGALIFSSNYSESLVQRTEDGTYVDDWIVDASDIAVSMDMTNHYISYKLINNINMAYLDFVDDILYDCDLNPSNGRVPLQIKDPIYGRKNSTFTDYAAPAVILTTVFFSAMTLTSGALLIERSEGILERYLVAGITGLEVLLSHATIQVIFMIMQSLSIFILSFLVFQFTQNGPIILVILMTILTGISGMCFGYLISCSCDTQNNVTFLAMGSFFPMAIMSGIVWPIQGMTPIMRYIAYFLPLGFPTEALRSILQRGWDLSNPLVHIGFIVTCVWCISFVIISLLLVKYKKK